MDHTDAAQTAARGFIQKLEQRAVRVIGLEAVQVDFVLDGVLSSAKPTKRRSADTRMPVDQIVAGLEIGGMDAAIEALFEDFALVAAPESGSI